MDNNNLRPIAGQGAEQTGGDWRTLFPPESRQNIVKTIIQILLRHIPPSALDRLEELKSIALRFEENIYKTAVSRDDYMKKISLKLATLESKKSLPSNSCSNNNRPLDSGASRNMEPQARNQDQPISKPMSNNQLQGRQQMISQNIPNTMGSTRVQSCSNTPSVSAQSKQPQNPQQNLIQPKAQKSVLQQKQPSLEQQPNASNLQPIQLTGQRNNVADMKKQQQRLPGQPNFQQTKFPSTHLNAKNMLPTQVKRSQQHLISKMQSRPTTQLQQQPNPIQRDTQPGFQASTQPRSSFIQQHVIDLQGPISDSSSSSDDSSSQTAHSNKGDDWQEEIYQRIKAMKEMYFPELSEIYRKIAHKLKLHDSLPQPHKPQLLDILRRAKARLENVMAFLQVSKSNIMPIFKEWLDSYGSRCVHFINLNKSGKPNPHPLQHISGGQPTSTNVTALSYSDASVSDSVKLSDPDTPDLEATATSRFKRPRIEPNNALLEEIAEINLRLIGTVVDVCAGDDDPTTFAEGTIVKFSYTAVGPSPRLKSHYVSGKMPRIQALRLLVPTNYPNCSPVLLDKLPVEISKENEDLSIKVKLKFERSLGRLSEPMSVKEIARTWDACARAAISEYAQRSFLEE